MYVCMYRCIYIYNASEEGGAGEAVRPAAPAGAAEPAGAPRVGFIHTYLHTYISVYIHTYIYIYMYVCIYIYMYILIYCCFLLLHIYVCIYIYIYMSRHICIHTYESIRME